MSNRKIKSHRNIYITKSNGFIYAITILYYALENLLRGYVVFFHRINNQSNKNKRETRKIWNWWIWLHITLILVIVSLIHAFVQHQIVYILWNFFEHQLYLNKIFKKKNTLTFYIINLKSICGLIQAMDPDIWLLLMGVPRFTLSVIHIGKKPLIKLY